MTAFLFFLTGCAMTAGVLGIIAAAAIWLANGPEARIDAEAAAIADEWDWPPSDTPIHDAIVVERFAQQLADDDLIRKAEQWGA